MRTLGIIEQPWGYQLRCLPTVQGWRRIVYPELALGWYLTGAGRTARDIVAAQLLLR